MQEERLTAEFIKQLNATAEALTPLTANHSAGNSVWNGTEYAKTGESTTPDPYALCWWAMLTATAALIEAQEASISAQQIKYLERTLFGGMGSLNDLSFDPKLKGDLGGKVNRLLEQQRQVLYASFRKLVERR